MGIYLVICIFFCHTLLQLYPTVDPGTPAGRERQHGGLCNYLPVIAPLALWAVMASGKNHSPEFRKLWADSKFNRGSLVSLVLIKIILCIAVTMGPVRPAPT